MSIIKQLYIFILLIVSAFSTAEAAGSLRTEYLLSNMQIMDKKHIKTCK